MTISLVLFAGLLIAGVATLVRSLYLGRSGQQGGGGPGPSASERGATPEQLLAQRFARGEIDEDEHRRAAGRAARGQRAAGEALIRAGQRCRGNAMTTPQGVRSAAASSMAGTSWYVRDWGFLRRG